jgi:hypothetical protein
VKFVMYSRRGDVRELGRLVESYIDEGMGGAGRGTAKDTVGQYGREYTKGHENDALFER